MVHIGTLGRIISIMFIVAIMWCLSTLFHSGTSGPFSTNATGILLVIALAGMSTLWSLSASVLRVAIEEEYAKYRTFGMPAVMATRTTRTAMTTMVMMMMMVMIDDDDDDVDGCGDGN